MLASSADNSWNVLAKVCSRHEQFTGPMGVNPQAHSLKAVSR